jgi:hypothetical protein
MLGRASGVLHHFYRGGAEGTGHDVLADAGPKVVHSVGEWLSKNAL